MTYISPAVYAMRAFLFCLCCVALVPAAALGQNVQNTKGAADQSLRGSFKVDPSTLGLGIQIPLQLYPGRAGLNLPVTLYYSSKVWRIRYTGFSRGQERGGGVPLPGEDNLTDYTLTQAVYGEDSAAGWTSSLSLPKLVYDTDSPASDEYNRDGHPCGDGGTGTYTAGDPCHPNNRKTVHRLRLRMPDGSTHELRNAAAIYSATLNDGSGAGLYEAVDDSRLRYDSVTGTTYLPDGSRYVREALDGQQVTTYVDRNGNKLTFMNDGTVRDTLGRTLAVPRLDENNLTRAAGDVDYYLPGLGGSLHYVFRWKYLTQARTDGDQTAYYAGDRLCGATYRQALSPSLFGSVGDDLVCGYQFNPVVLAEIELPNHQVYKFTYNKYGEIDQVVYPTGGREVYAHGQVSTLSGVGPTYAQANRGVTERWVGLTAAGPLLEPHWHYSSTGVTSTETSPDATLTQRLLHMGKGVAGVRFGFDDVRAGMPYEVRVYSPTNKLLRRSLTKWDYTEDLATTLTDGTPVYAQRLPRVTRQVEILLDTGDGSPLAKTTKYSYGQANEPLNVTTVTEYGFVEVARATAEGGLIDDIPSGPALRSTETLYKEEEAYRSRNIVALPSEVTVRAGEPSTNAAPGPIVARSLIYYDEESYFGTSLALLPCAPGQGREASTPAARGNVTTVSRWLDTLGGVGNTLAYIDAHAQYDRCGNARKSYEAAGRGTVSARVSETEYSVDYYSAYPTRTFTPTPDGTGEYGASVPLLSSSTYDLDTGVVLTVRDESNYTSTNRTETVYSYRDPDNPAQVDPLNRLRLVTNPDGGWTRYDYGDTPGDLYVRTRAALDSARSTDAYQYFDGLGRPTRSYAYDGASPLTWVASGKKYDPSGRVSEVSNPARVATFGAALPTAAVWTTTVYDPLGRVGSMTTPDGAVVSTEYKGATVTVTDQALNQRSCVSDALGRLTDVYEDPGGSNYHTSYQYDVLGNLRTATQGVQTRTFVYDSLGRLTSATNPEACRPEGEQCVAVPTAYEYNADGSLRRKTDPRGVQTNYEYDGLGRLKSRSYVTPELIPSTPDVTYRYDGAGVAAGVPNSKGRLTQVGSSVSAYSYDAYNVMGRVKASSQTTAGQTYAMSYEYDLAGNLKEETYPSGRKVVTGFDAAGRVATVTGVKVGEADRPYASQFGYAAHGAVAQLKLGNGLWEHTLYNNQLQPQEIGLGASASDAGVLKLEFGYGVIGAGGAVDATKNNGNLRSQTITVPGATTAFQQTYLYDKLNRLESAEEKVGPTSTWKQAYSYDRYGNRTLAAGTTSPAQFDATNNPAVSEASNRLTSAGYVYDVAGNLQCDALHQCASGGATSVAANLTVNRASFDYDGENRMVRAGSGGSGYGDGGSAYWYDGEGRRVRKAVTGGEVTVFVYDALGRVVAEYSNVVQTDGTSYLTQDHLGSTRVVTDAQGNAHSNNGAGGSRHDYFPFGEEIQAGVGGRTTIQGYDTVDNVRQKLTNKERDPETGLDFFGARYYASWQGRFTSCDAISATARHLANPQRWNAYAYVINSPLSLYDPDGNQDQGKGGGRVIDVFITFTPDQRGTGPDGRQDRGQNWRGLIREGQKRGVRVNVYYKTQAGNNEDAPTVARGVDSLASSGRTSIFIGHSDAGDNGKGVAVGNNLVMSDGGIGKGGVQSANVGGSPSVEPIPQINAAVVIVATCDASGAVSAFNSNMQPGSTIIYNDAGPDGLTALDTDERSGFAAAQVLVRGGTTDEAAQAMQKVVNEDVKLTSGGVRINEGDKIKVKQPKSQ